MPRTARLVASLRESGIAAVVSGAGPTVLALVRSADAEAVAGHVPKGWTVRPLQVDAHGARVLPLE
jgi:homoserine kinase